MAVFGFGVAVYILIDRRRLKKYFVLLYHNEAVAHILVALIAGLFFVVGLLGTLSVIGVFG